MKYRNFGRTHLQVSEIGFGAWGIGKKQWIGADDRESLHAIETAIDCGLNFVDTALAYGDGHSEQLVGAVWKRHPGLIVATKIPPKNGIWPARPGTPLSEVFPFDWIVSATEQSLKNLEAERVDIQQLHVWTPEWLETDDWRRGAEKLKKEGKVRFFGISVSEHEPDTVLSAIRTGAVETVQVIYNIFDQSPEEKLFPLCLERDIGVLARVPLDEGGLTGDIRPDSAFHPDDFRNQYFAGARKREVWEHVEKLRPVADRVGGSLAELALRFCLSHPAVSTVIPGMRSAARARENCAVSDRGPLPAEVLAELKQHRWMRNFYE
jgi:aryl-alcohol dehydrogenase-like predicted oxidoreductase